MVEAHIKQYRCTKSEACKTPMTSRAIRFRHQREQHEGSRHRCLEPGCPRSTTSLFPRAYNRDDHMKRTHGWAPNSPAKKRQPIARVQRQKKHKDQKASLQRRMDRADEVDSVEATFTEANAATESLTKHSALTDQHASSGAHVSSALFMAKAESTLDDFRSAEYQWNQQRNLVHSMTHVNSVCDRDGVVRLLDEASTFKQMTFEIHARFPNLGSVAYPPLWFWSSSKFRALDDADGSSVRLFIPLRCMVLRIWSLMLFVPGGARIATTNDIWWRGRLIDGRYLRNSTSNDTRPLGNPLMDDTLRSKLLDGWGQLTFRQYLTFEVFCLIDANCQLRMLTDEWMMMVHDDRRASDSCLMIDGFNDASSVKYEWTTASTMIIACYMNPIILSLLRGDRLPPQPARFLLTDGSPLPCCREQFRY